MSRCISHIKHLLLPGSFKNTLNNHFICKVKPEKQLPRNNPMPSTFEMVDNPSLAVGLLSPYATGYTRYSRHGRGREKQNAVEYVSRICVSRVLAGFISSGTFRCQRGVIAHRRPVKRFGCAPINHESAIYRKREWFVCAPARTVGHTHTHTHTTSGRVLRFSSWFPNLTIKGHLFRKLLTMPFLPHPFRRIDPKRIRNRRYIILSIIINGKRKFGRKRRSVINTFPVAYVEWSVTFKIIARGMVGLKNGNF